MSCSMAERAARSSSLTRCEAEEKGDLACWGGGGLLAASRAEEEGEEEVGEVASGS